MAERNILAGYKLAWSTDPHNSFIVSILGLGLIGAILYLIYILAPIFMSTRIKKRVGTNLYLKWISMHIMFFIYGITSSSYLAVPSMQLILFISFTFILLRLKPQEHDRSVI